MKKNSILYNITLLELLPFLKRKRVIYISSKGAYSASRYLDHAICYRADKVISVSEGFGIEPKDNEIGGIIVFSSNINIESRLIGWFFHVFPEIKNQIYKTRNNTANRHSKIGWRIGNFLSARYTTKSGKTYRENSSSVEVIGVNFDELITIAEALCVIFSQESVLVKYYR